MFPPAVYEGSSFCASLPTLVLVHLFDYSRTSGCEVVSHRGLDLHFGDGSFGSEFRALPQTNGMLQL